MEDNIVEIVMNMYNFNQDLMKLNIKYCEEIEELKDIISRLEQYLTLKQDERLCLSKTRKECYQDVYTRLQLIKEGKR